MGYSCMENKCLMKAVLKWKSLEKRSRGRPKQKWIGKVKIISKEIGIQVGETVAQDRYR